MDKITISTIAKELNLSKATVSLALNGDPRVNEVTRQKILDIARKYNFRPNYYARRLSRRKKTSDVYEIAVVATRATSVFISSIFSTIEEIVYREKEINMRFHFYSTLNKVNIRKKLFEKIVSEKSSDVIVAITLKPDDKIIETSYKTGVPVILIENDHPVAHSIKIDNFKGVFFALEHLKKIGKKNIAIIVGTLVPLEGEEFNPTAKERYDAACKWFKENFVYDYTRRFYYVYGYLYEEGYRLAQKILQDHPDIDGIFCAAGDIVASGVLAYLKEKGIKVPKDIAIIGYDNYKLVCENTEPTLTTVSQRLDLVAKHIFDTLKSIQYKEFSLKKFFIEPELVVRNSA